MGQAAWEAYMQAQIADGNGWYLTGGPEEPLVPDVCDEPEVPAAPDEPTVPVEPDDFY